MRWWVKKSRPENFFSFLFSSFSYHVKFPTDDDALQTLDESTVDETSHKRLAERLSRARLPPPVRQVAMRELRKVRCGVRCAVLRARVWAKEEERRQGRKETSKEGIKQGRSGINIHWRFAEPFRDPVKKFWTDFFLFFRSMVQHSHTHLHTHREKQCKEEKKENQVNFLSRPHHPVLFFSLFFFLFCFGR